MTSPSLSTYRLEDVVREGNGLKALIGSDYGGVRKERLFDQVVVNHGHTATG